MLLWRKLDTMRGAREQRYASRSTDPMLACPSADATEWTVSLMLRCESCKAQPHRSCRYYNRLSSCDILQINQLRVYMETNKDFFFSFQTHRDRVFVYWCICAAAGASRALICERRIDVKPFWHKASGSPEVYRAEIPCFHDRFCSRILKQLRWKQVVECANVTRQGSKIFQASRSASKFYIALCV